MLALVPDTEDDEEETIEGDLLIAYLQEESMKPKPEEKEPLNQPIQVDNSKILIRAKTSISQSLAHEVEVNEKRSFEDLIPREYHKYWSVFDKTASEWFPGTQPWDHRIDLKPEFVPKKSKIYLLNQKEEEEMNKFINDNLKKGFIHKSTSLQASPFFFIAKKDSQALRPCQDYRYLNESTIKNTYPLPSINDLLQKLHGAEIFTKLDIQWGYNNVWIKEDDEWSVSWKASYSISRNRCSQKELPWTSTRSHRWRRRIRSRIDQRSQKTRQRLSIFGSMEGVLRRDMGIRK